MSRTLDMKIVDVDVDDLTQHPENANNGDVEAISESIEVNGLYQPLLVQRSTGHIIAGNHRFIAAIELGFHTVPVIYLDVDDDHARRIMLVDNRTARLGMDDEAQLVELLDHLYSTDLGLAGTGYEYQQFERLRDSLTEPYVPEEIRGPERDTAGDAATKARLYLTAMPVRDEDGRVTEFSVTRPDLKHLTRGDLQAVRKAFGQEPLSKEELDSYDMPDWK